MKAHHAIPFDSRFLCHFVLRAYTAVARGMTGLMLALTTDRFKTVKAFWIMAPMCVGAAADDCR